MRYMSIIFFLFNYTVTSAEEKIEKLMGLLDIFEDNKDLKDLLNTQIALNRIKNET